MPWTKERRRGYNRQYYLEHRDQLLPRHRESIKRWREEHPERALAYKRENKEKTRLYRRRYYQRHREELLAKKKKWREEHPGYFREWREKLELRISSREAKMSKVSKLKQWVKEELIDIRFNEFEDVVRVIADEGESNGEGSAYEYKFRFNIYTEAHCYRINAIDRSEDDGYLGCTASTRKYRAGEDWTRGNDLADGKFTRETWGRIKSDIIAYELVKLAPKIERMVDEEKETKEAK